MCFCCPLLLPLPSAHYHQTDSAKKYYIHAIRSQFYLLCITKYHQFASVFNALLNTPYCLSHYNSNSGPSGAVLAAVLMSLAVDRHLSKMVVYIKPGSCTCMLILLLTNIISCLALNETLRQLIFLVKQWTHRLATPTKVRAAEGQRAKYFEYNKVGIHSNLW